MTFKKFFLFFSAFTSAFTLLTFCAEIQATQESDQQINEFSLAGYGEKGKKSWDLSGKSADIFDKIVKLKDVVGNLYGKEEEIRLTAEKGDFDKDEGKIHLEKDVVITTSSGAKLTTNSLDWDRKNSQVFTPDRVNILKNNIEVTALGAKGEPNLKQVFLEKEVKVNINPAEGAAPDEPEIKERIVITCDGPLAIDYEKNIATFNNNVKVDRPDSTITSDAMDVFFSAAAQGKTEGAEAEAGFMGNKLDKIVARGNVKVVRGENTSFSQEAIYNAIDKKLILTGRPQLIIYSKEGLGSASFGN
jgi:LPS export ABC transporter protein LptC